MFRLLFVMQCVRLVFVCFCLLLKDYSLFLIDSSRVWPYSPLMPVTAGKVVYNLYVSLSVSVTVGLGYVICHKVIGLSVWICLSLV